MMSRTSRSPKPKKVSKAIASKTSAKAGASKSAAKPKAEAKAVKPKAAAKPKAKAKAVTKSAASVSPKAGKAKPASPVQTAKASPAKRAKTKADKTKAGKTKVVKTKPAARTQPELELEVAELSGTNKGKVTRRILRPKFFPDIATQKPFGHAHDTPDLPAAYGQDKLVLMAKDPEWLFTYWEMTPECVSKGWQERAHGHQYQEALKLSWQPQGLFEPNYVFLPVEFTARKWYVAIPGDAPRSYRVEIGWLGENGHFVSLLQSEPMTLNESWAHTRERLMREGAVSAYTAKHTVNLGASEQAVIEESRGLYLLENLSSGLFSSSSLSVAQAVAAPKTKAKAATSARIEVTGNLPKGSSVRMAGQVFTADAKGRFKASVETQEPTLHLEIISSEGDARFFAYDLSTPA